jgi:hypothetical protein
VNKTSIMTQTVSKTRQTSLFMGRGKTKIEIQAQRHAKSRIAFL